MADFPLGRRFWRARPRLTRATLLGGLFATAFVIGIAWSSWSLVCREGACPDPTQLDAFQPRQTSKLFAADGRFIAELGLERRTLIKLADIPKPVQQAFIITEDKRFYDHAGIDWTRVFGAFAADIVHRNFAQGFSTLTMQLARNIFSEQISREKTLTRKLKEAKVARQIEARYPKEKILELYLNQIYLGNGAYGVETAAQHYFGKSVRDLNLAEAATLAALPKGPERYNPRKYPDRAIQRRNTIIGLMRKEGVVNDADARLAQAYPLQLARKSESGELAPYFVEFVRRQLEQMKVLIRAIARRLRERYSKPRKRQRRGHLDIRRTLRRNAAWGGVPFLTSWKRRHRDRPKIVAICDVSGSVAQVSDFFLLLIYSLHEVVDDVRSFAFSGHLIEVSDILDTKSPEAAMSEIMSKVGFGSSDYGGSLLDFEKGWIRTVTPKTTVIVLGDARTNNLDPRADILRRISERSKRLVWLNPEGRMAWGWGDSEMPRYAAFCSVVRQCATAKQLERAVSDIVAAYQ